jgi:hypothetical protein
MAPRAGLRQTDIVTSAEVGRTPLSVSADRVARTAMRCAGLLARLAGSRSIE